MGDYVYNLVDDGRGPFSQWVATGYGYDAVTTAFYADFADDVDFVVYFYLATTTFDNERTIFRDVYSPASPGLGLAAVNNRGIYGSLDNKRLTGVFALPLDMSPTAPTPKLHAGYLRNWGVALQGIDAWTSWRCWGNVSANGVRGGFDVTTVKDAAGNPVADPSTIPAGATFTVAAYDQLSNPDKAFSPIELWLMGLATKAEVPPLYSIENATLKVRSTATKTNTYLSNGIRKMTTDDIIALNPGGPPAATQKAFRTAFVLVTPTPATPEQMAKAEHYAKVVGGLEPDVPPAGQPRLLSFAEATGNRATMDVKLTRRPQAVLRLNIHPSNKFVVAKMDPVAFEGWRTGSYNQSSATVLPVTLPLYRMFKDDFDCIVFVLDIDTIPTGQPAGQHVPISNNVDGIGKNKFNHGSAYASSGRLKSHFTLWKRTFLEEGPFLHEFMHQFGNSVLETEMVSDYAVRNSGKSGYGDYGGHWGYSGCGGQLGGFDQSTLVENVDGIAGKYQASIQGMTNSTGTPNFSGIANGGNNAKYSNFELYLMGLLPEAELTSFDVFTGLSIDSADGMSTPKENTWNGKFRATKRVTYTKEKIVADFGARNPSCLQAQKNYNMLVVVLTTADTLAQSTADMLQGQITRMGLKGNDAQTSNNFWEATGGRGSMTFDVAASKK